MRELSIRELAATLRVAVRVAAVTVASRPVAEISLLVALFLSFGCAERDSSSNETQSKVAAKPRPSLTLRVLVVNEPELSEAINRLRGEWAERSIGELTATATSWADVAAAKSIDADVVVFPSRYLGELGTRGWLRLMRPHVLESEEFKAEDVFPLVRQEVIKWGGQVMALPLGVQLVRPSDSLGDQPAIALLARAAPRVVSEERLGVLFDAETMKPRIADAAFVDALAELTSSREKAGGEEPSPGPSLQGKGSRSDAAALVPLIGYGDRLAAVTTSSRNAASAFKLLEWLARADTSSQFARADGGMMPARKPLAASAKWYDPAMSASERGELGKELEAALSSEKCLVIPRIPGIDDYLAALDEAVNAAVSRAVPPQAALEKVAQRWEEITDVRGRDAQREAYLKHLGIAEP